MVDSHLVDSRLVEEERSTEGGDRGSWKGYPEEWVDFHEDSRRVIFEDDEAPVRMGGLRVVM